MDAEASREVIPICLVRAGENEEGVASARLNNRCPVTPVYGLWTQVRKMLPDT